MRNIISVLISIAFLLILSSCEDSLGINGADYLKSRNGSDTLYLDTMINFKKVTIITVITERDTIIEYRDRNIKYENIYSDGARLNISEDFDSLGGNPTKDLMYAPYNITSFLDYNPITPELSLVLELNNSINADSTHLYMKRDEIIKTFNFKFDKGNVIRDSQIPFSEFISNTGDNIFLETITIDGNTRVINPKYISGYIQFSNREINKGQISGISIAGFLSISASDKLGIKNYSMSFQIGLGFPEF